MKQHLYTIDWKVCVEESIDGFEFESILSYNFHNVENRSSSNNSVLAIRAKKKWSKFLQALSSHMPERKRCETFPTENHDDDNVRDKKNFEHHPNQTQQMHKKLHPLMLKSGELEYEDDYKCCENNDDLTVGTCSTYGSYADLNSCASAGEWTMESVISIEWEKKTTMSKAGRIASAVAKTLILILSIACLAGLYMMLL